MSTETSKHDGETDPSVQLHPETEPEVTNSVPQSNLAPRNQNTELAMPTVSGDGWDDLDDSDRIIPFLALLQDNSPQRKKQHEKYVQGAEEGMILNAATGQLWAPDKGLTIIPVYVQKVTVEWTPRDDEGGGGGFVGRTPGWEHPDIVRQQAQGVPPNKYRSSEGNVLKQTYYVWCIIDNGEEGIEYAILSFESTKIAAFKDFNSKASKATFTDAAGNKQRVPAWRLLVNVRTRFQRGKKGDFYNYVLNFQNVETGEVNATAWKTAILPEDDHRVIAARRFLESIQTGAVVADTNQSDEAESTSDDGDAPF